MGADEGLAVIIRTTAGKEYTTDRYTATDSSVVMQDIIVSSRREVIDPHEILYSEIESVKRVEISPFRTGLLVAGATAAFVAMLYAVASTLGAPKS